MGITFWRVRRRHAHLLSSLCVYALLGLFSAMPAKAAFLTRADLRSLPHGVGIALTGSEVSNITVQAATLSHPSRLLLDLHDTALATGVATSFSFPGMGVKQARLRQFRTQPNVVRLVLDLRDGAPPPTWRLVPGTRPEEVLIVLLPPKPLTLVLPAVKREKKSWIVRLAGAGYLDHNLGILEHPTRIFLDFTNAQVPASAGCSFSTGPISQVRLGQQAAVNDLPVARVAIELRSTQSFVTSVDKGDLVLSFQEVPVSSFASYEVPSLEEVSTYDVPAPPEEETYDVPLPPTPDSSEVPSPAEADGTYDVPPPPEALVSVKGKRIIIDPGHGDYDAGASWNSETETIREADVNLAIGLQLAEQLRAAGATVTMTREARDQFVELGARAQLANHLVTDIFVSIHCNAGGDANRLRGGTEVYYYYNDSFPLAHAVQEELVKELGTRDRGTVKYGFAVLAKTRCPAILVEVGFINYKGDRTLLTDSDTQTRIAAALVRGIDRYFANVKAWKKADTSDRKLED